jgi:hypothetical protein
MAIMAGMREKVAAFFSTVKDWVGEHKKLSVAIAVVVVAGLIAASIFWLKGTGPVDRTDSSGQSQEDQPPKLVPSPLTGVEVTPDLAARPVIGVMIENSQYARPQSGLAEAGVVFEAIAEGGITRFLVLYQENQPKNIGPVRSVRPYYVDWAQTFDAALAHVGGSPDGVAKAKSVLGYKDLDQFRYGTRAFDRVSFRSAPHNVYTSMARLYAIAIEAGHKHSEFTPLARKAKSPSPTPNASAITVNFSSKAFRVNWGYDPANNTYARSNAGKLQKDRHTGVTVRADCIVVLKMRYRNTGFSGRQEVVTTGNGPAYIFQDGTVITGSWIKASNTSQFIFKNDSGVEVQLNPGRTWFEIIPTNQSVSYK